MELQEIPHSGRKLRPITKPFSVRLSAISAVGRADFPENSLIFIGAEPINITESHIVMMEELGITEPVKSKQYGDDKGE